jgi:membrane protein required for colicin V production
MIQLNWVDFVILIVLLYYAFQGYSTGFIGSLLGLISFVASFVLGLKYYGEVGEILVKTFSIPQTFSNAIGFFILSFFTEIIIGLALRKLIAKRFTGFKVANRLLGILPGIFSGLVILTFILSLIITLPLAVFIKNSVLKSFIGGELVGRTQGFEKELNNIFGGTVNETLNFLTVAPKSSESVDLNFQIKTLV